MPAESVAELYARYRTRLEARARRILHDREEARDIVADVFADLLERGPDHDGARVAWLFTVVRNRALNAARSRARASHRLASLPVANEATEAQPRDEKSLALVLLAAKELDPRERTAVQLRQIDGLPYRDVAAVIGTTSANARVIVHRAGRKLFVETARALADHHGLAASCRDVVEEAAAKGRPPLHPGCAKCTSVADELNAMTSHAALPLALRPHVVRRIGDGWRGLTARLPVIDVSRAHAAEGLALILLGSALVATTGQTPPAVRQAAPAPRPAAVVPATSTATDERATVRVAPTPAAAATPGTTAGRRVVEPLGRSDPAGDSQLDSQAELLGLPVVLPDGVDPGTAAGLDIRRVTVGTLTDATGTRAEGLFVKLDLDQAPPPGGHYTVGWDFAGTNCFGFLDARMASQQGPTTSTVDSSCDDPGAIVSSTTDAPADTGLEIVGSSIAWVVPFDRLPAATARLLHPGATLAGINAQTDSGSVGNPVRWDKAPDHGAGPDYLVGTGTG